MLHGCISSQGDKKVYVNTYENVSSMTREASCKVLTLGDMWNVRLDLYRAFFSHQNYWAIAADERVRPTRDMKVRVLWYHID